MNSLSVVRLRVESIVTVGNIDASTSEGIQQQLTGLSRLEKNSESIRLTMEALTKRQVLGHCLFDLFPGIGAPVFQSFRSGKLFLEFAAELKSQFDAESIVADGVDVGIDSVFAYRSIGGSKIGGPRPRMFPGWTYHVWGCGGSKCYLHQMVRLDFPAVFPDTNAMSQRVAEHQNLNRLAGNR